MSCLRKRNFNGVKDLELSGFLTVTRTQSSFTKRLVKEGKRIRLKLLRIVMIILSLISTKLKIVFLNIFRNIFTSQETYDITETTNVVMNKLTQHMKSGLEAPFTTEEVIRPISSMKGLAAPCPMGYQLFSIIFTGTFRGLTSFLNLSIF